MTSPLRRRLRLLRRGAWYAAAGLLVTMALVAGAVSQLLPLVERHPERIAAWLSARAHRPVNFDHVTTEWTRRGPLLRLDGLRIGEGADTLQIGAAEILVSQYAGLLPGRSFTELRLRGLELALQREDDGSWHVRGLPGGQSKRDPFARLEGLGELQVIGGKLQIDAPALGIAARVPVVDLRLRVDGNRVRVGARARMRSEGEPIEARLDFDRRGGDGQAYLIAQQTDLSSWTPLLHAAGVAVDAGQGRIEAWGDLRKRRITGVTVNAALRAVHLRGVAPAVGSPASTFELGRVALRGRWQAIGGGWRLDAPYLRLGDAAAAQTLDGLTVAAGRRNVVLAKRVDAGTLLAIAMLSDRIAPDLRRWLQQSKPQATLHDIQIAGRGGGALQARGRIENFRFAPHGDTPGIAGLGGTLDGDSDGFRLAFDPAAMLRFDWPTGFGAPHDVHLHGTIAGWREASGWHVGTSGLRVDGVGYGADLRGDLGFQSDGTRPTIDLAARLDDTVVPIARRFWVKNRMSANSRRWLDNALLGGRVLDGRALISGDLDDWPFRSESGAPAKGLFEADARIVDAVVKFQPEWPAADYIDADVRFVADGFTVKGKGAIAGVALPKLEGGIPRFGKAELAVRADVASDAATMLELLKHSPLHKAHADTLDHLVAKGPATADFSLDLPLHADASAPMMGGSIELAGASLAEPRWDLAFDDVRGKAVYDRAGFDAENLQAQRDGTPGKLSLRAGPGHVRDPAQAFEAELDTTLTADALLSRAPEMAWLKPHVVGRSAWQIAVSVPAAQTANGAVVPPAAPARLQLRSDLVGTKLDLPAPLDKPAATPLAMRIDSRLPFGDGDIAVAFGQRLALRARSTGGRTGIRIALGSDRVAEAPPSSGLIASGRTTALDAIDWAALTSGGGSGRGLSLQRIDVQADRLQLLGTSFADAHVTAVPDPVGTAVHVDAPTIAGKVTLPRASGAAIVGRFERVYWTSAKAPANAAAVAPWPPAVAQDAGSDIDPGNIPPLAFDIADLRFGDTVFGQATLRTQPVAGGLRIAQLQARAPKQQVDVTGGWLGRGAAARTRLDAKVQSEDFGALLAGFGFGGRIAGGNGNATLDAAWPGSPAAFRADALQGTLSLSMKNGQLVDVEPGAGRVLGLLSVAQLPRRLMLDFRDFFSKGFAFNHIGGSVRFGDGQARSDDMGIDGPAAEIRIRGAADLRAQTFDQHIEVLPKSGNLLAVAGAIAGGPIGAAVGAVANAVLKKPLGEFGAKSYRVTGPWKEPKVEVVGHDGAPPPAASNPVPRGGSR